MLTILVFSDYYLPGYKAGGPIRSIASIVERLGDEFRFQIVTSDRDYGEREPHVGVVTGEWQPVGKAQVLYLSPPQQTLWYLRQLLANVHYDGVYLNSLFSPTTSKVLFLRRFNLAPQFCAIIAPRGELSPGAIAIKRVKKKTYITLACKSRLYSSVIWHASSKFEAHDISSTIYGSKEHGGSSTTLSKKCIHIAPNLSSQAPSSSIYQRICKRRGELKAVFISRISQKKNLLGALQYLMSIEQEIVFDIYGPIEDLSYWELCRSKIASLPQNVHTNYCGELKHDEVERVLRQYHLLFLPTYGENFGHIILEALLQGCLVLISDQTPWRGLEGQEIGWDLPLGEPSTFVRALKQALDMDEQTFSHWSTMARTHGEKLVGNAEIVSLNRSLFNGLQSHCI